MTEQILSLLGAFCITFYAIPVIINVSEKKHLFDVPDERKLHKKPIPSLGGVGIFAGFILSLIIFIPFNENLLFQYLVASSLIIFFVGIKDDVLDITPFKKFLGQLCAASILVFKGGLVLNDMHGLFGLHILPGPISYCLTIFTIVVITNAFNLIDGVDGLAGSLGALVCFSFGTYFAINGDQQFTVLAFAMGGALLAFLIFNFYPAKIFMGDTGSLMIGLISSVLVIHFIHYSPTASVLSFKAAPVVGFAVLFVPLFDTLRVFSLRIMRGLSPFNPDRIHIHHILQDKGLGHRMVSLTLLFANIVMIIVGCLGSFLNIHFLLGGLLLLGFGTVGLLIMANSKSKLRSVAIQNKTNSKEESKKVHNMVSINTKAANNQ